MKAQARKGKGGIPARVTPSHCNKKSPKVTPVVVVVLTLTRIIKSVVTGQAPVTGAEEYPREKTQTKGAHAHITADAIHASARKYKK